MFARRALVSALAPVILFSACTSSSESQGQTTLNVYAASSLATPFAFAALAYEKNHPGVKVQFNLGASSDLARFIQEGAPADVFASADITNMDKVESQDLLDSQSFIFATTYLEIIVEKGNPLNISSLQDLTDPDLIFVTTNPEVPIGRYTAEALEKASVTVTPDSLESNVKGIMLKVASGEADAGIVYHSEVIAADDQVEGVEIPTEFNIVAEFPIGIIKNSANKKEAQRFIDYLLSPVGQSLLTQYGFQTP
ncbi:MAG: molybdate ABC transporter substrate-binding protein [Actinomycetota bacterium]|nr:molybdate ABC transporter substrate-binding protein [Actinomycetota bacterium]MDA3019344.1 molybdate ABC transporter substrate-binding protein [Actinomycetota bacterium]